MTRRRRAAAIAARCRTLSVCSLLLAVLFYGTAPLATLWQAADGITAHDPEMLRTALDWSSVRDGLKQDLGGAPALALAGVSGPQQDELPAFGESFATGVVSHAIDNAVTPETLIDLLSEPATQALGGWRDAIGRIASLRFSGPTRFDAAFRMRPGDASPLLVSLQLSGWHWRITRVHLPADDAEPTARSDRT